MNGEAKKVDDRELDELLNDLDDDTSDYGKRVLQAAVVPISKPLKRGRGRPKKVYNPPAASVAEYHQAVIEQQVAFVEKDEIVKAVDSKKDSTATLQLLKGRIARSAATLEFIRLQQQKEGKFTREVPQIVSRQIAALREVASIELEINKLGASVVDLNSPQLQKVFMLLINTFRDVAKEMLGPAEFDLVWNKLETELEGWEEKADSLIR